MDKPQNEAPRGADVAQRVREVKRSLRGLMNGPLSQSMRDKGLAYRVNFGVDLPRLQELAAELPCDFSLAAALWQEQVRECRLLAPMVAPAEAFDEALADLWADQVRFPEEAAVLTFHLLSRLPFASTKAFEWIAAEAPMRQLCGWLLLGRLFQQGMRPTPRDADEVLDHAECALRQSDGPVRTAAGKTLLRFMDLGADEESSGQALLDRL